jgi:hypothetical protein
MSSTQCGTQSAGRRRRHTKKSKKHSRRRTRRGGAAFANMGSQPILGANGQPAGPEWGATGVSTSVANPNASNYNQDTAGTYASYGGRRRKSRGRRSRRSRHRMRGGTGGMSIGYGFTGDPVGGVAVGRSVIAPVSASGHETDASGYNRGF